MLNSSYENDRRTTIRYYSKPRFSRLVARDRISTSHRPYYLIAPFMLPQKNFKMMSRQSMAEEQGRSSQ
jgi:hypothetical protein